MAAGKTLRVKLRYRSRPTPTLNLDTRDSGRIKDLVMASAPEEFDPPAMDSILNPLQTSFDHGNQSSIPPPNTMMPLTSAAILSQRRRRKHSGSLKRSSSTPNVRGMASGDAGMTLAEKRRNKLGYHRTSVACGHCRRRKIRCLLAPDDTQNRCANCIRLKKDCSFFPVDQQPQIERRPRAPSRVDARGSISSESSPGMAGGHLLAQPEDFNSYQHLPLALPYPSRASIGSTLVSPMTRAPMAPQTYEVPQQSRSAWGSPFPGDAPTSASHSSPGDSTHPYWGRHTDSPMTPGFSPHMSGPTSALNSVSEPRSSFTSFAPSRTHSDSTWAMSQRSMSFGVVEDLPQSYQNQYNTAQPLHMDYRRRASEMNPPSLLNSNNSSNASIPDSHLSPLPPISSSSPNPPIQHWGVPTSWGALSSSLVTKAPDYGGWYSDTPPLAKVQEEDLGHYGSEPTIIYAGDPQ